MPGTGSVAVRGTLEEVEATDGDGFEGVRIFDSSPRPGAADELAADKLLSVIEEDIR